MNIHQGWGESVLTSTLDAIKNADSTAGNIASLVFEAKVDIIRVPDFMASLSDPEYEQRILHRYTLANVGKGVNGTLMLDKQEEYESKSTSFANLPEVIDRFFQIAAGAADIPLTRLLGTSPGGLEYVVGWRMTLAKNLLRRDKITVAEAAERVGYGSASAFSTAFARRVGIPPALYARAG